MIFLNYSLVEADKGRVMAIVYKSEELFNEMLGTGLYVESIPNPESGVAGTPVLYVTPSTKELWYEYLPIPEEPLYAATPIGELQKQLDDVKLALAELMAGGTV